MLILQWLFYSCRKGRYMNMCCRYYVPGEMSEFLILKYLDKINEKPKNGEIYPSDLSLVIYGSGGISVTGMKWGFSTRNGVVFNARGETYEEKYLFAPYALKRCAAVCSEYYEWKNKIKYAVRPEDKIPLFLAGIYRQIPGNGYEFTIITLPPVGEIADLHDRMPLAVTNDAAEAWLSGKDVQYVYNAVPKLYYEKA